MRWCRCGDAFWFFVGVGRVGGGVDELGVTDRFPLFVYLVVPLPLILPETCYAGTVVFVVEAIKSGCFVIPEPVRDAWGYA